MECPACGARFRLDTDFSLLDVKRGQWIVAAPVAGLPDWPAHEQAARELFERAYGATASELAQEIGKRLKPRIVFGWPALREKVLAAEHGLDDIALEACKAAVMRGVKGLPVSGVADLRLADVDGDQLVLAWLRSYDSAEGDAVSLPRADYDKIAAELDGAWASLRSEFDGALFVDPNRMLAKQRKAA
jgi:hypothetical protein